MMMRGSSSASSSAHRSFVFLLYLVFFLSLPLIDGGGGITSQANRLIVRGGGNAETLLPPEEPEDALLDHRQRGLQLYQEQSYIEAAKEFHLAAAENSTSPDEGSNDDAYATLKLHEALCYLQAEQYDAVISICTSLLEEATYSTAIRARAYYRRAKAYHHQQDEKDHSDQVLADARSAAFLGDKKAVAFYGKLMRSSGGDATEASSTAAATSNPFVSASSNGMAGINPLSSFLAPSGTSNSASSLVQSVLKSLLKRIDDRATQEQICHYLQTQTSAAQLQQYGALVGLQGVPTSVWERLVGICHGMSLPRLRRLVFCTKGVAFTVQLGRKLLRLGRKYRTLIAAGFLGGWIRSALRRPLPISKRRRRQLAATAATSNSASLLRQ